MVADLPIYRRDTTGEYYAVFDKPTIEQIVVRFFKQGKQNNVNEMHSPTQKVGGMTMFESMIIDTTRGVSAPSGFQSAPDGSWFGSFKVDNDELWQQVKDGTFKGFSVEGFFDRQVEADEDEATIQAIIDSIQEN